MNVLVTGIAGFIGFHLSKTLMDYDVNVIGIDNLNNYYGNRLIHLLFLGVCGFKF